MLGLSHLQDFNHLVCISMMLGQIARQVYGKLLRALVLCFSQSKLR